MQTVTRYKYCLNILIDQSSLICFERIIGFTMLKLSVANTYVRCLVINF